MIRRTLAPFVAALVLPLLAALPARAGVQDFTVVNQGAVDIWHIFVSPNYSDSWEEDVLGNSVLQPGLELGVTMNNYGSHCYFDIRIEDFNGVAEEYYDVDLCSLSYVYFPSNASSGGATKNSGSGGGTQLTVVNSSANAVWYIYISPASSDSWGDDWLQSEVLMPGYQQSFSLAGFGNQCLFDVRVEDLNGYALEYAGVNVCSGQYVDFP